MNSAKILVASLMCIAVTAAGCGQDKSASQATDDQALETIWSLLKLHGVEGKQPQDRTKKEKHEKVDKAALSNLILDLDTHEEFVAKLYVGFVVGAAARNQAHLLLTRQGKRSTVTAGKVKIQLELINGAWKIDLGKSVPMRFQKMAMEEQDRYDSAKAAGRAYN